MSQPVVYTESHGQGSQLIFFHGWGMHSGVFKPVVDELQQQFNILLVDLPGHGYSQPFEGFCDIDNCTDYLFEQLKDKINERAVFCGWSTGSLIAQNMVIRHPELVDKLVLITGTPSFEIKSDWSKGIDPELLERFNNDLLSDFDKTLSRFLALQFMHVEGQKQNLRLARELVFSRPSPDLEMLKAGLSLLMSTDLRAKLAMIQVETLILNGERDSLVPTSAARFLAEQLGQARAIIFKSCGHAPFLSHANQFNQHLKQFLI